MPIEYSRNNPAEEASYTAFQEVCECIDNNRCFELRAGAGAGKTFTLGNALKHIIEEKGRKLLQRNQRVACITYTNVAKDEISSRIDNHPAVITETIHSFCWMMIKDFQIKLRSLVPELSDRWKERIVDKELDDLGARKVVYTEGHPYISEDEVSLHHNDIPSLMVSLMTIPKFQSILYNRFPVVFIDEYQDTNKDFASALLEYFIEPNLPILVGFFGDPWQKIYGDGYGEIASGSIETIGLGSNFRSAPVIINGLNLIRPELPQDPKDPEERGEIVIVDTNPWVGTRRRGGHWAGDLPVEEAHQALKETQAYLGENGWDFDSKNTKILMLTHNVLASEQGYSDLIAAFRGQNDGLIKLEHPHVEFFINTLEPAILAYSNRKFGQMFDVLRNKSIPSLRNNADKILWTEEWNRFAAFGDGEDATIGEVIAFINESRTLSLPDKLLELERKLDESNNDEEIRENESTNVSILSRIKDVSYAQVKAFRHFLDENTLFSTKHGVKGAEFENVLIVLGRGWNHYNWNQLLEWGTLENVPSDKKEAFIRNRNLFYVACSRPKKRLCLLFTQKLSDAAQYQLNTWFPEAERREINLD